MSTALTKREKLTPAERRDLKDCINTVKAARWALMDAAAALQEARQRKLYREQYSTFEEFCRAEFGMERRHAYRLLDAGKVFARLQCVPRDTSLTIEGPQECVHVDTFPSSEGQVRPLTALSAPLQQQAWKLAVQHAGGGQPTGKQVAFAARLVTGQPAALVPAAEPSERYAAPILALIAQLDPAAPAQAAALRTVISAAEKQLSQ